MFIEFVAFPLEKSYLSSDLKFSSHDVNDCISFALGKYETLHLPYLITLRIVTKDLIIYKKILLIHYEKDYPIFPIFYNDVDYVLSNTLQD